MPRGKHEFSKKESLTPEEQADHHIMTFIQIIGLIGTFITIFLFIQSCLSPSGGKGQNADVQTGGGSQSNVIQTENGDVNLQLSSADKTSEAPEVPMSSESVSELSCRDRLAKSYDLVHAARESEEYGGAISTIREMIKAEDTDLLTMTILQYNLGLLLYDSGEVGAAQEAFREALRGGGFASAFYCLGIACVKVEEEKPAPNYQEAIEAFTHAIEEVEKPEYYSARAWAYEKSGLPEQADQDRAAAEKLLAANESSF